MKKELIELGYIVDITGKKWDVYCESKTFKGRGEDLEVVCEGITLEHQEGDLFSYEYSPSLSEMPDRFSQRQVNALEEWILEQERNDQIAYAIDNAYDQMRGNE